MLHKRLNNTTKIYTPASGTTVYIDYSSKLRILEVEFSAGKTYHYHGVTPEVWNAYKHLIASGGSSGEFVNRKIKPKYPYTQII